MRPALVVFPSPSDAPNAVFVANPDGSLEEAVSDEVGVERVRRILRTKAAANDWATFFASMADWNPRPQTFAFVEVADGVSAEEFLKSLG